MKAQSPACTALVQLHLRSELCNTWLGVKLLKTVCMALGIAAKSRLRSVGQAFTSRRCWRNSFLSNLISCGLMIGESHWKWDFGLFSAGEPTNSRLFTSDKRALIFSSLLLWDFKFCLIRGLFSLGFVDLLSAAPAHPTHGNKAGGIAALWFPSGLKSA